ncbi:hypothetical protein [Deinococcus pimensis]|uniref:hypothetical protein n=1 Tax=Deinococcus pimensis TaxID=309888 RepID=UPI00047F81BD|nr:hypothetical protein [Deinococcus pimensis]
MIALTLLGVTVLCTVVHLAGLCLGTVLAGERVGTVGLFGGPTLLRLRLLGVTLRLGLVPVGGYVTSRFPNGNAPAPFIAAVMNACGPLALLLLGALLIGWVDALGEFGRGFGQLFWGALMPRAHGAALVLGAADLVARGQVALVVGLLAVKMAALNLLPFTGSNGGALLESLLGAGRSARVAGVLGAPQLALLAVLLVGWGVAIVLAVLTG